MNENLPVVFSEFVAEKATIRVVSDAGVGSTRALTNSRNSFLLQLKLTTGLAILSLVFSCPKGETLHAVFDGQARSGFSWRDPGLITNSILSVGFCFNQEKSGYFILQTLNQRCFEISVLSSKFMMAGPFFGNFEKKNFLKIF